MVRFALLLLLTSLASSHAAASVNVAELRCEYLGDPLGIDVAQPRLSWKLQAGAPEQRGLRQSAFRVLVASRPGLLAEGKADLWDSGDVESDRSVHVIYGGKPLTSRTRCHWKVRVRDGDGQWSAW